MVRNLIGARRSHGEHRIPGVDRNVRGEKLGVRQGDGGAAKGHQDAAALGIGGKGGGEGGTGGSRGAGEAGGPGGPGGARRACDSGQTRRAVRPGGTGGARRSRSAIRPGGPGRAGGASGSGRTSRTGGTRGAVRTGGAGCSSSPGRASRTSGTSCPHRTDRAFRSSGACGTRDPGGALGGTGGTSGPGRSGRTGQDGCGHSRTQLAGQQHLLLHDVRHGVLHALVDLHDLRKGGRLPQAGQGAQDILQLLPLGVEDVAQAEFLGGDGGNDLIEASLAGQRGVDLRESWH